MLGRNRVVKAALTRCAVGAANHFEARCVGRYGKGHRIVLVRLAHVASGQDNHFIGIGEYRGMDFGAPYHDAIGPFVDDTDVVVRVFLRRWRQTPIAFHIGLGPCDRQIVIGAVAIERLDPAEIIRTLMIVHITRQHM